MTDPIAEIEAELAEVEDWLVAVSMCEPSPDDRVLITDTPWTEPTGAKLGRMNERLEDLLVLDPRADALQTRLHATSFFIGSAFGVDVDKYLTEDDDD